MIDDTITNVEQAWLGQRQAQANNILTRSNLQLNHGHYRSLTFSAKQSINPLVTACAPLLSIASQLHASKHYQDISTLHENLVHEIRAFESQAQEAGIRSEAILAARYALCALFDDIILNTPWGNETNWGEYRLLALFQHEPQGKEHFFAILSKLSADPAIYIDILELMYLCLSFGFVGRYRHADNGVATRSELMDQLYHTIRMQRGEFSQQLAEKAERHSPTSQTKSAFRPWRTLIMTALCMLGISLGFNYLMHLNSSPLSQGLSKIIHGKSQ